MARKIIIFFVVGFFVTLNSAFAGIKRPPVKYTFLYNNDVRHGEENFYSHRLEILFEKELSISSKYKVATKVIPFVELRYNVERHKRERTMSGIEFGFEPVSFFYAGEQIRYSRYSEALYQRRVIDNADMWETLTIVELSCQLIPGKNVLKGYARGEYTYDLRDGRGTRMETVVGLLVPIGKHINANIDWRHRDRIHYFDCETFELSASYIF